MNVPPCSSRSLPSPLSCSPLVHHSMPRSLSPNLPPLFSLFLSLLPLSLLWGDFTISDLWPLHQPRAADALWRVKAMTRTLYREVSRSGAPPPQTPAPPGSGLLPLVSVGQWHQWSPPPQWPLWASTEREHRGPSSANRVYRPGPAGAFQWIL